MKYLSIIRYILLALSVIIVVYGLSAANESTGVEVMLQWTSILLYATVAAVIVFPMMVMMQNPKSALRSLFGLAILVVVALVAYSMSTADPIVTAGGAVLSNPTELLLADIGIYTTYIVFCGVIVSILCSEVYNLTK